jgi:glucokinase
MYIGIEIGGTKLQLGLGTGDGQLQSMWRGTVDLSRGGDGIRDQILGAVPVLLDRANVGRSQLKGIGVGFGGPVDDATRSVIKSHQVTGWDGFPLADWLGQALQLPAVLGNDADVAGLAEATLGAGRGCDPVFYITIGSGIGGGLIVDGRIARGTGRGAAEIGHLRLPNPHRTDGSREILEHLASGWAIGRYAREAASSQMIAIAGSVEAITAQTVAEAIAQGDPVAKQVLDRSLSALAEAICATIVLVCPQKVVIGGGVSLMGDDLVFGPLRAKVAERVFGPFAGLTDIVPAALGEAVVVHGAIALCRGER